MLIDCPVSGKDVQAESADLVLLPSGPDWAIEKIKPVLKSIGHTVVNAGEFDEGSKLKFVANHAVVLHNTAAAETLHFADSLGLDRQTVFQLLNSGAGQSKMSELRMPMMIEGKYEPTSATMSMFEKDFSVIGNEIKKHGIKTPIFDAVRKLYDWFFENLAKHMTARRCLRHTARTKVNPYNELSQLSNFKV